MFVREMMSVGLGMAMCAGGVFADTYTYQGRLEVDGVGANGLYDFRFALNENGDRVVGGVREYEDVEVVDGLFTVDVELNERWLDPEEEMFIQVEVRDGGSTGGYTMMLPMTAINSVPFASYALNGEFTRDGSVLELGFSTDRLLMNPFGSNGDFVNTSTVFQLNSQSTRDPGFVVNGRSNRKPWFGIAVNNESKVWMGLDDDESGYSFWSHLSFDPVMTVTPNEASVVKDFRVGQDLRVENSMKVADQVITDGVFVQEYSSGEYHEATPRVYGTVKPDATVEGGTGNFSVSWDSSAKAYVVDLPFSFSFRLGTVMVTPIDVQPVIATTSSLNGNLYVLLDGLKCLRKQGT